MIVVVWQINRIVIPQKLDIIIMVMQYNPHTDKGFQFLAFSYFYKEPKKFEGGQLYFPKYDYEVPCDNNSMIIFPGWVEHGVRESKY